MFEMDGWCQAAPPRDRKPAGHALFALVSPGGFQRGCWGWDHPTPLGKRGDSLAPILELNCLFGTT